MHIVQLSDFHVRGDDRLSFRVVDTRRCLDEAVTHLKNLRRTPDALVLTGDLADNGDAQAYRILRESISSLGWPTYAVPGNHDRRDRMREILPEWCPADPNVAPFLCYTVEKGPVRLVMIDTMNPGSHDGHCLGYAPWSSLWPSVQAALVDFRVRASIVCINWGASLPFPLHPRRGPCSCNGFASGHLSALPLRGPPGEQHLEGALPPQTPPAGE